MISLDISKIVRIVTAQNDYRVDEGSVVGEVMTVEVEGADPPSWFVQTNVLRFPVSGKTDDYAGEQMLVPIHAVLAFEVLSHPGLFPDVIPG